MNQKGLTLVEMIGTVTLLVIIALIVTPVVNGIINDSKKKALMNSGEGMIRSAESFYYKYTFNHDIETEIVFTYTDGNVTNAENQILEVEGPIPGDGEIAVDFEGEISFAFYNGRYCITKAYNVDVVDINEVSSLANCNRP